MEKAGLFWAISTAPSSLLLMYFFSAALTAFPVLAMADWLNNVIAMPVATQSQFFAFVFIPYWMKPLYAILSETISGHSLPLFRRRSRALLLHLCGAVSTVLFACILFVTTVPGAFAVFFGINLACACAELMLGAYLMVMYSHMLARATRGHS